MVRHLSNNAEAQRDADDQRDQESVGVLLSGYRSNRNQRVQENEFASLVQGVNPKKREVAVQATLVHKNRHEGKQNVRRDPQQDVTGHRRLSSHYSR